MLSLEIINKINKLYEKDFLGDSLLFSEDEKSQIYDEVGRILNNVLNNRGENIPSYRYKVVVVALVELTKEWNLDSESWFSFLFKKLVGSSVSDEKKGKFYSQITKCISSIGSKKPNFLFQCFKKTFYTSICCQAFAPKYSINSFLDMCWQIYCDDLLEEYKYDKDLLDLITNSLRNWFNKINNNVDNDVDNDDDIKLGGHVYQFRAGIKGLIIDYPLLFKKLLNISLTSINQLLYETYFDIGDSYFKSLIYDWWRNKKSSFGLDEKIKKVNRKVYVASNYSNIKIKYQLENGIAKLVLYPFRLPNDNDSLLKIIIKANGNIQKEIPIPTSCGSGIIKTSKLVEIKLDDLNFNNAIDLEADISLGSEIIFQSKNMLKRDFLLFLGDKEIKEQNLLPNNYFLYSISFNDLKCEVLSKSKVEGSRRLFSIQTKDGSYLISSNRYISFQSENSSNEITDHCQREVKNAYFLEDGIKYTIVDGDYYIFLSKRYNSNNYGIKINNAYFKLNDFNSIEVDGFLRFTVNLKIMNLKKASIVVFRYSDNQVILNSSIIGFHNVKIIYDKNIYYGNQSDGVVEFTSDELNLKNGFSIFQGKISFSHDNGQIILFPPLLQWRLDKGDWNIKEKFPFYYKELTNSTLLKVDIPDNLDYKLEIKNKDESVLEKIDKDGEFKIGQTLYNLASKSYSDLIISVKCNDTSFVLYQVIMKSQFLNAPIDLRKKGCELYWNPSSYVGQKSFGLIKLHIFNEQGVFIKEEHVSLESSKIIQIRIPEGFYNIKVFAITNKFIRKEEVLFEKKYYFGEEKNIPFRNKVMKINKVVIFDKQSKNTSFSYLSMQYYIFNIKYLGNDSEFDLYSGELFFFRNGIWKIYKDSNPIRIELKTMSSCFIGYGLDIKSPDFDYNGEFSINNDNELSFSNKEKRTVDYYIFDLISKSEVK